MNDADREALVNEIRSSDRSGRLRIIEEETADLLTLNKNQRRAMWALVSLVIAVAGLYWKLVSRVDVLEHEMAWTHETLTNIGAAVGAASVPRRKE